MAKRSKPRSGHCWNGVHFRCSSKRHCTCNCHNWSDKQWKSYFTRESNKQWYKRESGVFVPAYCELNTVSLPQ